MKQDHGKLMRDNGIPTESMREVDAYECLVDLLVEDKKRLWDMIKTIQEASSDAGIIGMAGSKAWIAQLKKAAKNVN